MSNEIVDVTMKLHSYVLIEIFCLIASIVGVILLCLSHISKDSKWELSKEDLLKRLNTISTILGVVLMLTVPVCALCLFHLAYFWINGEWFR